MKTLIIDNFDSFTYNVYQYCAELGGNPVVKRNNETGVDEIRKKRYTHLILSPGPGSPEKRADFGICSDVITACAALPILGVCLGHQGIVHFLGGTVARAPQPMHGKTSRVRVDNSHPLFKGVPAEINAMRYHSLVAQRDSMPEELEIIGEVASGEDAGVVMAVAAKNRPLFGIQFHPESFATEYGKQILGNFLKRWRP